MRQDTAQDIAGRLYRNLLPFGSGATHKYVLNRLTWIFSSVYL